jgi:hypothetical protein
MGRERYARRREWEVTQGETSSILVLGRMQAGIHFPVRTEGSACMV